MRKFCGRFSFRRSKTHNMRLCSAKMYYNKSGQTVCLRLWRTFLFLQGLRDHFRQTRVWSLPCSLSSSFSGQKARPAGTTPMRILALPQVKKRRNSKSFFSRPKSALHLNKCSKERRWRPVASRCFWPPAPASPREVFLRTEAPLGLSDPPGPAALWQQDSRCNLPPVPGGGDDYSGLHLRVSPASRYSFLP